jgi:phage baseplate assembly protein W
MDIISGGQASRRWDDRIRIVHIVVVGVTIEGSKSISGSRHRNSGRVERRYRRLRGSDPNRVRFQSRINGQLFFH